MRKKTGFTVVKRATETIEGFASACKLLHQQVTLRGQSKSTLENYIRRIAGISLVAAPCLQRGVYGLEF